jgi:hypothetical protein
VIQNGTLVGGSPALVVDSGNVVLNNVTAINATNAPTIMLNGGSLVVRDTTIQGTASSPGGNTFNVNGTGTLIQNLTAIPISAIGNTFENNGAGSASNFGTVSLSAPIGQTVNQGVPQPLSLGSLSDTVSDSQSWALDVDWGDGSAHTDFNAASTGPLGTQPHAFALPGSYTVTVTATDPIGSGAVAWDLVQTFSITVAPSIFVLDPKAAGALTLSGNASLKIPGAVVVDSNAKNAVSAAGNAQVSASAIDVVGGVQKSGNASFHPAPTTGIASVADPLVGLPSPATAGLTSYGSVSLSGNSSRTISPGVYSQISASGNASLTMSSGIYIIEGGGFTVTGSASVAGSGVMIYNAGSNYPGSGGNFGGISLSGNGTFRLTAPTSGTYAGVLIFQSRQNTRALSFSGGAMGSMTGTIYAPSALLSMSGSASLSNPLDVGMLNLSGNVALTQIAAGSDGTGDTSGIANTLLAGNLSVYVNDPNGLFTADELARIQDAINAWDALLAPYSVTITEVSDPTQANITIDTGSTSAAGGAAQGVLGCFNAPNAEITILQGWNWYAGSDPTQIGSSQYDFETTVLHELGHALGLGGSTVSTSPMYETLASGVADRTPTTQDLNIPDPPAGADPQMAAGFGPGSAATPSTQAGRPAALGSATVLNPTSLMALPSSSGPRSVLGSPFPAAGVQAGTQASPEPSLVVQRADEGNGRRRPLSESQAGLVLDAALADLITDEERSRDRADGGTNEALPLPGAGDAHDGFGPDGIRSDEARPAPASRAVEIPRVLDGFLGRRLRPVLVSDPLLDELADDAAELRGQTTVESGGPSLLRAAGVPNPPVPGGPTTEPDRPGEAGGVLARLAVSLFAAGFWGYRGRILDVTNRRARRPHPRRIPRSSGASGPNATESTDD